MGELEMIKAFAKLDGANIRTSDKNNLSWYHSTGSVYSPTSDGLLAFKAMIKYNVRIMGQKIYIDSMRNKSTVVCVDINNPSSVAHSIIECILKHNNLWSDK